MDNPRTKKFEHSIAKLDFGKLFTRKALHAVSQFSLCAPMPTGCDWIVVVFNNRMVQVLKIIHC